MTDVSRHLLGSPKPLGPTDERPSSSLDNDHLPSEGSLDIEAIVMAGAVPAATVLLCCLLCVIMLIRDRRDVYNKIRKWRGLKSVEEEAAEKKQREELQEQEPRPSMLL